MLVMGFISNSIYYYNNWINSGFSVKEAKKFLDIRYQLRLAVLDFLEDLESLEFLESLESLLP